MKMPYQRWSRADTFWFLLILGLAAVATQGSNVTPSDGFYIGLFAALAGLGWWKNREARERDWKHEFERERRRQEQG